MISELISSTTSFLSHVQKGRSVNVNDQASKASAVTLANQYFGSVRPSIVQALGEAEELLNHDEKWQDLVRLAHGNNARRSYVSSLKALLKQLNEFSITIMTRPGGVAAGAQASAISSEESRMIQTLERIVPSAAASYHQAVSDLADESRLSYRGTASEFREALRETLDHLAPDDEVAKQPGYSPEPNQSKPTMKQKVRFVLTSRDRNKTQRESAEKSVAFVSELSGEIARAVYNRASLATHVQESRKEVHRIKRYVDTVLSDLLEL